MAPPCKKRAAYYLYCHFQCFCPCCHFCCSSHACEWETMTIPEAHYCVILILWDESDESSHPEEGSNLQDVGSVDQSIQNCQEDVHYFLEFSNTLLLQTSHLRAGVYHGLSYSKITWLWKTKGLFYRPLSGPQQQSQTLCDLSSHLDSPLAWRH